MADIVSNLPVSDITNGTPGSAAPALAQQVGGTDGSNLRTIATDTSGNQKVVGNVASGAADSGNPIKIGGIYNSTLPTFTSGSRANLQLDSRGRLITSPAVTTDLVSASYTSNPSINGGVTNYSIFTVASTVALRQFYVGGTGVGKQSLFLYSSAATQFINQGDFEVPADIGTTWVWTSVGGTGSIASSTAQFFTGARSVQLTFSNSSGNNAQGVRQTFSSPISVSSWRYITAQFYNTLSAGGAYTRTISIILTDSGGGTKKFDVSGLSTAAPFNSSGWIKITGEIQNPTSVTGTSFDDSQVVSIELRMADTANKSGVVYWDTVQFESSLSLIFPVYHLGSTSFNIAINPVYVVNAAQQLAIAQTNNDTVRREYFASASGVLI